MSESSWFVEKIIVKESVNSPFEFQFPCHSWLECSVASSLASRKIACRGTFGRDHALLCASIDSVNCIDQRCNYCLHRLSNVAGLNGQGATAQHYTRGARAVFCSGDLKLCFWY